MGVGALSCEERGWGGLLEGSVEDWRPDLLKKSAENNSLAFSI